MYSDFPLYRPFAISTTDYKDAPTCCIAVEMDCSSSDWFICTFHFTNRDNQDYYLLDTHTPFEGFASPFITVTKSDGTQLDYEGTFAGRYHITKEELVHLEAHTTKSVSVEVSSAYNFNGDGIYTIHYNTPLVYMSENEFASLQESDSVSEAKFSSIPLQMSENVLVENTANFPKTARQIVLEKEESLNKMNVDVEREKCQIGNIEGGSSSWKTSLRTAHALICADTGLYNARHYAYYPNTDLYREWFGTGAGAYDKFNDMAYGAEWSTLNYDITNDASWCLQPSYYGYAVRGSKLVSLCDDFFTYPSGCTATLDYTQEGCLVHEWSHALADTGDHGYGTANARNLATNNPSTAVQNAENYHFFYCDAKT